MIAPALCAAILLCPQPLDLEEAIRRLASGDALPANAITTAVATEAAQRVWDSTTQDATRRLLIVAGGANLPLDTLARLPPRTPVPRPLLALWAGADLPRPATRVAVALVTQRLTPRQLAQGIGQDDLPEARRRYLATLVAITTDSPRLLYPALADLPFEAVDDALAILVQGHEAVAVDALARAQHQATPAVLRSLGQVGSTQREGARDLLIRVIDALGADPARVAAAIDAGGRLLLSDVADRLPLLVGKQQPVAVRRAALRAVPALLYRDLATLQLLVSLLSDPDVSAAAYASLLTKSGVQLPPDPTTWQHWLAGRDLPPELPAQRTARLQQAWRLNVLLAAHRSPNAGAPVLPAPETAAPAARSDALQAWHTADRRRVRVLGAEVIRKTRTLPYAVAGALLLLGLLVLARRRWVEAVPATRPRTPHTPDERSSEVDLALVPTRRLDRLRHSLHRGRGVDQPSALLARSAEADLFSAYREAIARLRAFEHERLFAAGSRGTGHLVFAASRRGASDPLESTQPVLGLFEADGETTPLSELFTAEDDALEEEEKTTPLNEVFPEPTQEEKTTPLSEVFDDDAAPTEEQTTPLSEVFDDDAAPAEERTTPLSKVFDDDAAPAEERTTPLSKVFDDDAAPAEERTTPLSKVFDDDAAPAEERTTPLSKVFDDPSNSSDAPVLDDALADIAKSGGGVP